MNIFKKLHPVSVVFDQWGPETFAEEVAFSSPAAVVGESEPPGDPLHNLGDGILVVFGGSDAEMEVGVHESIGVELEGVLLFVVGNDFSQELEVGSLFEKEIGVDASHGDVVSDARSGYPWWPAHADYASNPRATCAWHRSRTVLRCASPSPLPRFQMLLVNTDYGALSGCEQVPGFVLDLTLQR